MNTQDGFWFKVRKNIDYYARLSRRWLRARRWDVQRLPADRPVIVIGCSRAGTTLVYKTLSESPQLGTLQRETHDFWMELHHPAQTNWATHAIDATLASAADRDHVSRYFYTHTGRRRFVDKNNQNGLCVPYLYRLFPDAQFVFVKRSPGDNLNSLIEGWGKADEFATWSAQLPAKVDVENGQYSRWCFFLAEGWRDYLNAPIEDVCAFQYVAINQAIVDAKALVPPSQWCEVFYEDLVADPVAGFRQLYQQLGLSFDAAVEHHCAEVLSKPYNAFSAIRLHKWKEGRNRERIERVLPRVQAVAQAMGYREADWQ